MLLNKMNHIWLLFAVFLLCSAKLPAAEWTVLVYMAADNSLNSDALADINEMEAANLNANINVIVQIDEAESSQTPGTRCYKIQHDTQPSQITSPIIQDLGEIDSGDYQNLVDFANWGFDLYPATHNLLVIWSHGNSWYKGNTPKWICSDDASNSAINVWNGDLKEAISSIPKLDVLLFDACSMQSIEVLNEVYRNCDYVIGSEDLVPSSGFPYTEILNLVAGNVSPSALATQIPSLFVNSYNPYQSQNPTGDTIKASCSYADCSKFPALRQRIDEFGTIWKMQPAVFSPIRNNLVNFNDLEADVDLHELFTKAISGSANAELVADATVMHSVFHEVYPVQYNNYNDDSVGYSTIWFPETRNLFGGLWRHYGYLEFAGTSWSAFLNHYNSPDETAPLKPQIVSAHQELNSLYLGWTPAPDPGLLKYNVWLQDAQGHINQLISQLDQTNAIIPISQSLVVLVYSVDEVGNISVPDTLEYAFKQAPSQMYFSPTPIHDIQTARLHIYIPSTNLKFQWAIYDVTGKIVFSRQFDFPLEDRNAFRDITINLYNHPELEKLSSGVYLSTVSGDGIKLGTKLVITK